MENEEIANKIRQWSKALTLRPAFPTDDRLDSLMREVIEDMDETSQKLSPKTTLCCRIVITRKWSEDEKYVLPRMVDGKSPFKAWKEQISDEFNECGWEGQCSGESVITIYSSPQSVTVKESWNGDAEVSFVAVVHCRYGDLGQSFASDAEVIQHLFYDLGGVVGDFTMHPVQ